MSESKDSNWTDSTKGILKKSIELTVRPNVEVIKAKAENVLQASQKLLEMGKNKIINLKQNAKALGLGDPTGWALLGATAQNVWLTSILISSHIAPPEAKLAGTALAIVAGTVSSSAALGMFRGAALNHKEKFNS